MGTTKRISDLDSLLFNDMSASDLSIIRDVSASAHKRSTIADIKNALDIFSFGTCSTAAGAQSLTVVIPAMTVAKSNGITAPVAGMTIKVMFTNGYTCSKSVPASGTNVIALANAPTLAVSGMTALPIKVANEYAGINFVTAGDIHELTCDGTNWVDRNAVNIYSNSDSSSSYVKQRDGQIKQKAFSTQVMNQSIGTSTDWTYVTTSFPFTFYKKPFVEIKTNTSSSTHFSYWGLTSEVLSIAESYAIWRYRKTNTDDYNNNGITFYINISA